MDWAKDGATWPLSRYSRFVMHKPHHWHMQDAGSGPVLLLLHGAGGSTHSWRHLIPLLIPHYRIVAVDLPGQGFTRLGASHRCGLDAMAEDLVSLCEDQNLQPAAIIGHSAGAAIALRMVETQTSAQTPKVIGINAALDTFHGLAGVLFPLLARTIAVLPMAATLFSTTASKGRSVDRILERTGSALRPDDIALYRRLVASPSHVDATLQMMARWKLEPLLQRLPMITAKTTFIVGSKDTTVPPVTSQRAASRMPFACCVMLEGLGHLAHEEDASRIAAHIVEALKQGPEHPST